MARAMYNFGPFSSDLAARMLYRNGERVAIPPKAADLLVALIEREGQLVTKDDLLRQVWPDTFVEEGNLARHISLLRKVLGESAAGSCLLETVPKRGYRFLRTPTTTGDTIVVTSGEHTSGLRPHIAYLRVSHKSDQWPWSRPRKNAGHDCIRSPVGLTREGNIWPVPSVLPV